MCDLVYHSLGLDRCRHPPEISLEMLAPFPVVVSLSLIYNSCRQSSILDLEPAAEFRAAPGGWPCRSDGGSGCVVSRAGQRHRGAGPAAAAGEAGRGAPAGQGRRQRRAGERGRGAHAQTAELAQRAAGGPIETVGGRQGNFRIGDWICWWIAREGRADGTTGPLLYVFLQETGKAGLH
jgi:hypothetical protein